MKKIIFAMLILGLITTPFAYAHEQRAVGDARFVVGFVNEPAFNGEMNAIDLRVSDKDGKPIEELEQNLKVEVGYGEGSEVMEIPFRKRYNQPGAYDAYFLPVQPGKYRFHIHGTIAEQAVDETFTSGEGFHDVENSKDVAFPRVRFKKK